MLIDPGMSLSDYRLECEAATARDDFTTLWSYYRKESRYRRSNSPEAQRNDTKSRQLSTKPGHPVIICIISTPSPSENAGATRRNYLLCSTVSIQKTPYMANRTHHLDCCQMTVPSISKRRELVAYYVGIAVPW